MYFPLQLQIYPKGRASKDMCLEIIGLILEFASIYREE